MARMPRFLWSGSRQSEFDERQVRHVLSAAESGVMGGFPSAIEARATLDNWLAAPFNRWSFLHTREIVASAAVNRGVDCAVELPSQHGSPGQVEFKLPDGRGTTLDEFLDDSWADGLIVVRHGAVEYEAYRNAMTPETPHIVMSVSKSITSLVVGILADRGVIDLSSLVTSYAPELLGTAYEGATLQHLLDMQVACGWLEDHESEASDVWRLDVASGWAPPREGAAPTLFDFVQQLPRGGVHGERVQYLSPNADLLGIIAERATQSRLADLVSRELWKPCGMQYAADLAIDPAGTAVADGGFCTTLRDLALIGVLFLNRGKVGGRQVVPAWWLDECRREIDKPFLAASTGADIPDASYHNLWWRMDGRTFALGINGQMVAVDDKAEMVAVFLSSSPGATDEVAVQRRIVAALAEV